MLNLDTHVLLQAVGGRLSASETRLLRNDRWSISAIVLWEVAKLAQLGRIELDLDDAESARSPACISGRSLGRSRAPATSLVHNVPLVTRDRMLRRSRQIPLAS